MPYFLLPGPCPRPELSHESVSLELLSSDVWLSLDLLHDVSEELVSSELWLSLLGLLQDVEEDEDLLPLPRLEPLLDFDEMHLSVLPRLPRLLLLLLGVLPLPHMSSSSSSDDDEDDDDEDDLPLLPRLDDLLDEQLDSMGLMVGKCVGK